MVMVARNPNDTFLHHGKLAEDTSTVTRSLRYSSSQNCTLSRTPHVHSGSDQWRELVKTMMVLQNNSLFLDHPSHHLNPAGQATVASVDLVWWPGEGIGPPHCLKRYKFTGKSM